MIPVRNLVVVWITALSCIVMSAIAQEKKTQQIKDWGEVVDPDGDCQVSEEKGKVTITVPGTYHDLNPTPRFNNLSAPRIVKEVEGDFTVQVKTLGFPRPSAKTSTKIHSYVAAGLVVWQDGNSFLRFVRAANGDSNVLFASAELYKDGKLAGDRGALITDRDTYLRIERRKEEFLFSVSLDGRNWHHIPTPAYELPKSLKVGVVALNSTNKPFAPQFEEFKILRP